MSIQARMEEKLRAAFDPLVLEIENQSHLHAGHASSPGTGESHFEVRLVSAVFSGLSRVERQRQVYGVLAEELSGPVHALALRTLTPEEAGENG